MYFKWCYMTPGLRMCKRANEQPNKTMLNYLCFLTALDFKVKDMWWRLFFGLTPPNRQGGMPSKEGSGPKNKL